MISWKKSLDHLEASEKQFRAFLDCYLSALTSIEQHAVPVNADLLYEHRKQLKGLRRRIVAAGPGGSLDQHAAELDEQLKSYCVRAEAVLAQREGEVKEVVRTLAEITDTLTSRNEGYHDRLKGFGLRFETLSEMNDLSSLRRQLREQARELKNCIHAISQESQSSLEGLRKELNTVQHRLTMAERLAATDPLTGVANRREGERQLEAAIRSGEQFCILIFDLDRFKSINDRWGHHCGDQVLKTFASRLSNGVRPEDTVCRWGGDEFLVIFRNGLQIAINRAQSLATSCGGEYHIAFGDRPLRVPVASSVGVAGYKQGETIEQVFARADSLLYRKKASGQVHTSAVTPIDGRG